MTKSVILGDGRALAYAEYGDLAGFPVFFFHGFPSSRLQAGDFHESALAKGIRLIGVDRPGMGRSTPSKQHTLLTWASDIAELTGKLGITQFSIIAHSGGAPFALACAHVLPKQVSSVTLVSGLAPTTLPEATLGMPMGFRVMNVLARRVTGFSWLLMQLQKNILMRPGVFKRTIEQLPKIDQAVVGESHRQAQMMDAVKEAFHQGVSGAAYEFRLILKDWGFNLEAIQSPISVWHGKLDTQAPAAFATCLASRLPNATLALLEEDAHLSSLYGHIEELLGTCIPKTS